MFYVLLGIPAAILLARVARSRRIVGWPAWAGAAFAASLLAMGMGGLFASSLLIRLGFDTWSLFAEVFIHTGAIAGWAGGVYATMLLLEDFGEVPFMDPWALSVPLDDDDTPTLEL